LDSSVLAKWFSPEVDYQFVRHLRSDYLEEECELAIPDLALYGLANALRYSGRFNSKEIAEHIRGIIELEVAVLPLNLAIWEAAINLRLVCPHLRYSVFCIIMTYVRQ
jgi:predicted nucleic acid-binding protein